MSKALQLVLDYHNQNSQPANIAINDGKPKPMTDANRFHSLAAALIKDVMELHLKYEGEE